MADILIANAEAHIRNILEENLSKQGYHCIQAADVQEARGHLQRQSFDLALVDTNIDRQSGLDFIQYTRGTFPDMEIILVTGLDDAPAIKDAIEAGIYSYLLKPFERCQVLLSVKNALYYRKSRFYQKKLGKMLEEKVREVKKNESVLRSITSLAHDAIIMMDHEGKVRFWNAVAERILGYTEKETLGKEILMLVHPDDQKRIREITRKRKKGEPASSKYEFRGIRKDGTSLDLLVVLSQTSYFGEPRDIAFLRDITRRKQTQRVVRVERAKFNAMLNGITEFIYVIDPMTYEILYANRALKDALGRDPVGCVCYRELYGFDSPCDFCPGDVIIRNDGKPYYWQYHNPRLNKDYKVVDRIIKWFDGRDVRFVFAVDISELLTAKVELQKAHTRMKQLFTAISSILIALDAEGKITEWNRPAEDLFGIAREDVLRKDLFDLNIKWNEEKVKKALDESRKEVQIKRLEEIRYKGLDGKDRFLGITINPMFDEERVVIGTMLRAADITRKKRLESQLSQAQKLESIGQLSAGIAHEINTPIQYVGDNIGFLKESFDDVTRLVKGYKELVEICKKGKGIEEAVQQAEEVAEEADWEYLEKEIPLAIEQSLMGVERVANIVRAMKEFSHPGTDKKILADINRAIENTIIVAKNEWKYVAEMVTDLDPSLGAVPCLPGELNQAILNLIVNAAQAIADVVGDGSEGKGAITIRTRRHEKWAEIQIEDTGTGIPPENQSKIFDPFFTTKEVGKGTGQGLSLVYNVITVKHGGSIYLASTVGKGTIFTIRLPLEI